MSVYQATVDPAERNTSHTMMLELVGGNQAVLDVGCASGYLAEALGKNGNVVSGIEYDAGDAEKARPFLEDLVVADLNVVDLAEQFPAHCFDVIVFGDVLEHLLYPVSVLRSSLTLLRPGGTIVISIPNVAHGAVRLSLLQGNWDYSATGLLDRTHLRFFTFDTLLAMLEEVGLSLAELRSTVADPLGTEIAVDGGDLPPDAVDWVRHQAHAQVYQFVLAAKVAAETGAIAEDGSIQHARDVVPAVPMEPVHDIHAEVVELKAQIAQLDQLLAQERERVRALRRQVLTSRDHAIGTEAQLGRLRAEVGKAQAQMAAAVADAHYAHTELAKSIKDSQQAHALLAEQHWMRHRMAVAVGPRAWRMMTAPLRPLRRVLMGPGR